MTKQSSGKNRPIEVVKFCASVCTILSIIPLVTIWVMGYLNHPVLTYEDELHEWNADQSLICISIKNEGRASANDVEVNIEVNGKIDNLRVQKGLIVGQIQEAKLFDTSPVMDKQEESAEVKVPYIGKGMKYLIDLVLAETKEENISWNLLVQSSNGGIAKEFVPKAGFSWLSLLVAFVLGSFFSIALRYLLGRIGAWRISRVKAAPNPPKPPKPKKKEA